ncbi:HAD-IA family hydrolase [Streptomyces sp. NA04227]|uniref:HAD family hydrolase n=1 Tax=Streptomyces sp. NA04227 TaxID=2742136 RepID=UPI0015903117|nr:HAD-IA family hydrolase [Streptomyces sp. NA04227]QKW05244.1 HAD-IA family hydrolase [Streptomyces sp. NA04227]
MAIKGVLFDFSGTLFRVESVESWLRGGLERAGTSLPEEETAALAHRLDEAGALPGGSTPRRVPDDLLGLWRTRDEDADRHRAAYLALSRQVALPDPQLHELLYERHKSPEAWRPYPDAVEVLTALRARSLAIGVLSNIGWDLRPVFRAHGLDSYVDTYTLSYEHGVQKPDPRLFTVACAALGFDPREVLMVGDERAADGGAARIGCAVHFVEHLPVAERPDGLRGVLGRVD